MNGKVCGHCVDKFRFTKLYKGIKLSKTEPLTQVFEKVTPQLIQLVLTIGEC